jgi:hypothetical protein
VYFQSGMSGTITLTSARLEIAQDIAIAGPGANMITISGNNLFQAFNIAPGVAVTIAGLTIANGSSSDGDGHGISNSGLLVLTDCTIRDNGMSPALDVTGHGGGIYNSGILVITDSTLVSNHSNDSRSGWDYGGAIYNSGTLTVTDSAFNGNQAGPSSYGPSGYGGAICNTGTLTVTGCTFSDNVSSNGPGSAIYNSGRLAVTGSTLSGNFAGSPTGGQGGAICNDLQAVATVTNSTLSENGVGGKGGGIGGGVLNLGTLALSSCTLTNNGAGGPGAGSGGGIVNSGTLTITNSMLSGNGAARGGGIDNSGTLTIVASTLSANRATAIPPFFQGTGFGGGTYNSGTLSIVASWITGNLAGSSQEASGGGIYNDSTGTLTVLDSTVSANSAQGAALIVLRPANSFGGGIYNAGMLTVLESTFSGNNVQVRNSVGGLPGDAYGGGIYNAGDAQLIASTLSGNSATFDTVGETTAGGLYNLSASAALSIGNTIVAGNLASTSPDLMGSLNSPGHNLIGIGDGGTGFTETDLVGTSAKPLDPELGPLQDNGGPTQTMALLPGSPAIDAGAFTDSEWDQRGPGYSRLVNGATDIGAFEVQDSESPGATTRTALFPDPPLLVPGTVPSQVLTPTASPGGTTTRSEPSHQAVAAVDSLFALHRKEEPEFLLIHPSCAASGEPDALASRRMDLFQGVTGGWTSSKE